MHNNHLSVDLPSNNKPSQRKASKELARVVKRLERNSYKDTLQSLYTRFLSMHDELGKSYDNIVTKIKKKHAKKPPKRKDSGTKPNTMLSIGKDGK